MRFDRCYKDSWGCTVEHLEAIERFLNDPNVRAIYEYHMDKLQSFADSIGLGMYFEKLRFLSDLILMFWGLGYSYHKIIESEAIDNIILNILKKFQSNYIIEITDNIHKDWDLVTVLIMTIPGKSCEAIGTRIGIVTRKITGVAIEGMTHGIKSTQNTIVSVNDGFNQFGKIGEEHMD